MKIQKFNEASTIWSETRFKQLDHEKIVMSYLIINFINTLYEENKFDKSKYEISDYWFEEDGNKDVYFAVSVEYIGSSNHMNRYETENFTKDEFDDLITFMNNPEEYIESKKYNL